MSTNKRLTTEEFISELFSKNEAYFFYQENSIINILNYELEKLKKCNLKFYKEEHELLLKSRIKDFENRIKIKKQLFKENKDAFTELLDFSTNMNLFFLIFKTIRNESIPEFKNFYNEKKKNDDFFIKYLNPSINELNNGFANELKDFLLRLIKIFISYRLIVELFKKDFSSKKANGNETTKGKSNKEIKNPLLYSVNTLECFFTSIDNKYYSSIMKDIKSQIDSISFLSLNKILNEMYKKLFMETYKLFYKQKFIKELNYNDKMDIEILNATKEYLEYFLNYMKSKPTKMVSIKSFKILLKEDTLLYNLK